MDSLTSKLAENFFSWETRGRGSNPYAKPVLPEPPYTPFPGHKIVPTKPVDSRKHTLTSGFLTRFENALRPPKIAPPAPDPELHVDPTLDESNSAGLRELRVLLPAELEIDANLQAQFYAALGYDEHPITFEIVGTQQDIVAQFAVQQSDQSLLLEQLKAHFPSMASVPSNNHLEDRWWDDNAYGVVSEFCLAEPFMLPLAKPGKADPYLALFGALGELGQGETGLLQVRFAPVENPWAVQSLASITTSEGRPYFSDGAFLVAGAKEKMSQPLFAVTLRLAAKAAELDRAWEILRKMAAFLRNYSRYEGNEFAPLLNDDYDDAKHVADVANRQWRRTGMIVSLAELVALAHFPSAAVKSKKLLRMDSSTRPAPIRTNPEGVCLGVNEHAGEQRDVWLANEQRVRHTHILGASGYGKTNLLFNLMQQDLQSGTGFALLDPHGDLHEKILGAIPSHRRDDVIVIDPSDEEFVVPFNFLQAHSEFEKTLLASDLVAIFKAQSTSWGDQMNSVLGNAILAFLESSQGGTLADVRRFLLDADWRDSFLKTVADPEVEFYWKRGFPQLGGNKSIGPVLTRLETFLAPKPIRYMVSQRENRIDFAEIMDRGKVLLIKLPQGIIGKENSHLLGSLMVSKLQQTAMSRQRMAGSDRRDFFLYIDEAHNFICPSMGEILSGARKYRMGLILAHQDLRQLERNREVASGVMANCYTRIAFRVSDSDAKSLAEGFAHFDAKDFQNLDVGKALCRIERADHDFNLRVTFVDSISPIKEEQTRSDVIARSRSKFAIAKDVLEQALRTGQPLKQEVETPAKSNTAPAIVSSNEKRGGETGSEKDATGKGGHQHLLMQERIKSAAEALGFKAVLEMPTEHGRESIDVGLVRGDIRLACEVSVSTTIDHEIGNARKCLRAGFDPVILVTADARRREQLRQAVDGHFAPTEATKVRCHSIEECLSLLETVPLPQTPDDVPTTTDAVVKGYTVRRTFTTLTPEEWNAKSKAAFELLRMEMKLPPP